MRLSHSRVGVGAVSMIVLAVVAFARPAAATTAAALCGAAANPCVVNTAITVDDLSVIDLGNRALLVTSTGSLNVGSGTMTILAGVITVEQGGSITGLGSGSLPGGIITMRGSDLNVAGLIRSDGAPPRDITLEFTGAVTISGTVSARALFRNASGAVIVVEGASANISGTLDARAGTEDSSGGEIDVTTVASMTISGTITTVGPDGGGITLEAGTGFGGGNLTLTRSSRLFADGAFQSGFGGNVDLSAAGNALTTGSIQLGGAITVTGHNNPSIELGGGSGGCLTILADGNVVADNPTGFADCGPGSVGALCVRGGGTDGDGGEIDISTNVGTVVLASPVDVSAPGNDGGAGTFSIDAGGPIVVVSSINAAGGEGGDVALTSTNGSVTVDSGATINTSGRAGGSGGSICLESASVRAGMPAAVVSSGMLLADGGAGLGPITGGLGGAIELIGLDSARLAGLASAEGGLGGGLGGGVVVTANDGPAFVEGTVRARGRGEAGGSVAVDGSRIEMRGSIDVSGSTGGAALTDIGLRSTGAIFIAGPMTASGSPGSGGLIEVISEGTVAIAGTLTADAGTMPGGRVLVRGCTVLNCIPTAEGCDGGTGAVRALGPGGTNRFTGRDQVIVFGTMTANNQTGRNEVVVRPPTSENAVILGGVATPAAVVIADDTLLPCPVCGNRVIEPPETCDDGNTMDGDGCSSTCRLEGLIIPGDANGDFVVNDDDIGFLAAEIYDGDGDQLGDVSGGAFRGSPGADANDDDRITAADFVALAEILGE